MLFFKKKMRTCFKCEKEFPDSFETCPMCYPSDVELSPLNVTIMVIIFVVLGYVIYFAW